MSPLPGISVCIVCRNEAEKLTRCLETVRWADEVLVMDLASEDESLRVAERFGARIVSREPHPIVEPLRNELAALARHEWILALDPDESLADGLAPELRRISGTDDVDAIIIPRMNIDLGYAPSHPVQRYEPQLRMYRKERVTWPSVPNKLPAVAESRLHRLPQRDDLVIVHDRSRNVPEIVERIGRYAPAQAQSMIDAGTVFRATAMLSAIWAQFDKEFFRAEAWRDGVPGISRAAILTMYKVYVWIAFWQLSGAERLAHDDRFWLRLGRLLSGLRRILRAVGVVISAPKRLRSAVARAFSKNSGA